MCGSDVRRSSYTQVQASSAGTSGTDALSEGPVKTFSFGDEMNIPAVEENCPGKVIFDPGENAVEPDKAKAKALLESSSTSMMPVDTVMLATVSMAMTMDMALDMMLFT